MLKIVAIILAVILILTAGYIVVKGIINLFTGYNFGDAFGAAWEDVIHLWGLIKSKTADIEFPMANANITWDYARAYVP